MIMRILIFPTDNSTFHFLLNCLSSSPCLVGFPPGPVSILWFLLKLTFVTRKMVDMQNVEQVPPRASVILSVC